MRIGVDLLPFGERLAGTGTYAQNLIRCLGEIDGGNSYTLYVTRGAAKHFTVDRPNFDLVICPLPTRGRAARILWEQMFLPVQLLVDRIDLLFVPSVAKPVWTPCKTVSTIHDLAPFTLTQKYSWSRTLYVKLMTILSARLSDCVIAVSEATKRDLVEVAGVPEEKIFVVYHGVSEAFRNSASRVVSRGVPDVVSAKEKYILFVGTLEPGKNIRRLVQAFENIRNGCRYKLVIAGGKGWLYDEILSTIAESRFKNDIVVTGYVDIEDLRSLYQNASVFVYPSLYEGFGLPPLEAMSCGVPVITSNVSSLPEVVDEAGVLVDPYSVEAIAMAMRKVITNDRLRASLVQSGLERAAKFSWFEAAENTLKVFRTVCGRE